jgi:hypothetical protein
MKPIRKKQLLQLLRFVFTAFCTKDVTSFRVADEYPEEGNSIFLRNADINLQITQSAL